ncbi:MAG: HD domain-containing protein [Gemmiger sp.]|nr:HD domain-containing protein [Gemmiger sp.]
MKQFDFKRTCSVLLGLILPVGLVIGVLVYTMQSSYLKAADTFGASFGANLVSQAKTAVQQVTDENWNTVNVASVGLPRDFAAYTTTEQTSWLKALAAYNQGRNATYLYYSQSGQCVGSDGTVSEMYYTARPDISSVLAGTEDRAMYGPIYEDSADSDDAAAQEGETGERSGYAVYYTLPVRDANGTVLGALSLRRDAYEYSDVINSLNLGEGGYTYLVDSEDIVVAVSRNEMLPLVTGETSHAGLDDLRAQAESAALGGVSGTLQIAGTDGTDGTEAATLIYAPLRELSEEQTETWGILCYLPERDLQGYMANLVSADVTGQLVIRLAVVLLVALAIFYLVWDTVRARKAASATRAREYHDVLEQTLRALAGTYDACNSSDTGHGYRVAAYAREIGKHLDLTPAQQQNLYFEAALHDIGMVAIPEEIHRHQAEQKLTAEEALRLREHVTVGGRILGKLTGLPGINVGAMYHQQHYDGTGYCSSDVEPAKGEGIPLEARIITVADVYDELDTLGRTDIDALLEKGKGQRFDPLLADIMVQLIRDGSIRRLTNQTNEAMRNDSAELAEV